MAELFFINKKILQESFVVILDGVSLEMINQEGTVRKCLIFGELDHEFVLDFERGAPQNLDFFDFDTVFFADDRDSHPGALGFDGSAFDKVVDKTAQFVAKYLFFIDVFVDELVGFAHAFEEIFGCLFYHVVFEDDERQSLQIGLLFRMI